MICRRRSNARDSEIRSVKARRWASFWLVTFSERPIYAPARLEADGFVLRPIVAADAQLDYEAVMESRNFLRRWNQSTWPEDDFTVEANREDMVKMEQRHIAGEAFGYTMMNLDQTECLGCVYIFPPDAKWFAGGEISAVGSDRWSDCDVMTFFWVRASRLPDELDRRLLDALTAWVDRDWPFQSPVFVTNEQFEQQVAMIEASPLDRRFEIRLPTDPGRYFAYA